MNAPDRDFAIYLRHTGGPEVLKAEPVMLVAPGLGEVLIRHQAVGLNFHDIYVRSGSYDRKLPLIPGVEAVGVVEAVGPEVTDFVVGDYVGWIDETYGGYVTRCIKAAAKLIRIPDSMPPEIAATTLVRGMTVAVLVNGLKHPHAGDTCIVHAAAGGIGLLLVQWLKHLEVKVVGVVGSPSKIEGARVAGCDVVLWQGGGDLIKAVEHLSNGRGATVAFDAVGKDTFEESLAALAPGGVLASFGQSSGPPPPLMMSTLLPNSLAVWRPALFAHMRTPTERDRLAASFFSAVAEGWLKPADPTRFALAEADRAHAALESRSTTGTIVLLP